MDQQLKFNILTEVVGSEKVEQLKSKFSDLSSKVTFAAGGVYLAQKAFEYASSAVGKFSEAINFGDELEAISERTGISAQALSGFKAAADQSNLSFEELQKGLKKFSQQMGDSNNIKFQGELKRLGVDAVDPLTHKMKDAGSVVKELADKFENMQNGPKKAAIAIDLFGKAGDKMIPFLNQGSEALEKFGVKFSNSFSVNADAFNDNLAILKNKFTQNIVDMVDGALPGLLKLQQALSDIFTRDQSGNNSFGKSFIEGLSVAIDYAYRFWTILSNGFDALKMVVEYIAAQVGTIVGALAQLKNGFSAAIDAWKNGIVEARKIFDDFANRVTDRNNKMMTLNKASSEIMSGALESVKRKNPKIEASDLFDEKAETAIKKFKLTQEESIRVEKLKLDAYKMSAAELQKLTISEQLKLQAQKESVTFSQEYKNKMMSVTDEIIKQKKALIDQQEAQKQSFSIGARTALRDYLENISNVAKQTEGMFTRAFGNIEDSLVSFVRTGQLNFKKFTEAILDDLARIAVRQATLGFLTSVGMTVGGASSAASSGANVASNTGYLGGNYKLANGGVMTSMGPLPLRAYANGGVANKAQVAIFGEGSHPEAFVPLPDGKSIPVSMRGSAATNIVVNVNMATNETQVTSGQGEALGRTIAAVVKNQIIIEKRPGGLLSG